MVLESPTDGQLQPARKALADAISDLIDPRPQPTDQGLQWLDSRYSDLREALTAQRIGSSHKPASKPPGWLDAIELLARIDAAVHGWEPAWPISDCDEYPTIQRLRQLDARKWRPQDTALVARIASDIAAFIQAIDKLLEPPRIIYLANPCPECAKTETYRKPEAAGEPPIRVAALQITYDATCDGDHKDTHIQASCNHCRTIWTKDQLGILGRRIGNKIEGVLDHE